MISDLITLDPESLKAPDSRIGSIIGVRGRIKEFQTGNKNRSLKRSLVQGLIDGNAPYDNAKMVTAGRGDDANINFREAEGLVAAATTPYYELDFGVPRAVNIQLRYGDNKAKWFEWSETVSNLYSETLWAWKGYKINKQLSHYQMVVHGRGPIIWESKRGWHFKAITDDAVWVADDAMCDLDLLEELAMPDHFEPTELFRKVDKGVAEKSGWDVSLAKQAIINAAPKSLRDEWGDSWTQYQTSLRRGDVWWSNKSSRIFYYNYLLKEFDGKITRCLVLEVQPDKGQGMEMEDKFLFKKERWFEDFHQIIVPFHFDVGPDATWYSVKGLGPKIFDFCDASNRFRCTMINGAMASCGIPLQAMNANAIQKIQQTPLVRASGITFIPPDWNVQKVDMRGALDGPLEILRELQLTMQSNTGQYRQRVSQENQEPTLGQAQLNVQQQATLTSGAYDRYYHYDDDMHTEIVRRMLDPNISKDDCGGQEAIDFKEQCIKEGVPEEALDMDHIYCVHAFRQVGQGSKQMQQITGQQLMALLPTMSEKGRRNALRMNGATLVGQEHVDSLWEPFEEVGIPNDQEAMATLENNLFKNPDYEKLVVTPEQNHPTHFESHYKSALSHIQQVQGGQGDPVGLVRHLDNSGVNMHEHLEKMQGDPTRKDQIGQYTKMLMGLGKVTDQVKQQVMQAQAQAQPPQPQVDPEALKDMVKLAADIKMKETKQITDDKRKDTKLAADIRRKDLTSAANIYRKNAETIEQPAA